MTLAKIARIAKEEQEEFYFQIFPFPTLAILAILARDISGSPSSPQTTLSVRLLWNA
jgi:hypothetical protein